MSQVAAFVRSHMNCSLLFQRKMEQSGKMPLASLQNQSNCYTRVKVQLQAYESYYITECDRSCFKNSTDYNTIT